MAEPRIHWRTPPNAIGPKNAPVPFMVNEQRHGSRAKEVVAANSRLDHDGVFKVDEDWIGAIPKKDVQVVQVAVADALGVHSADG